MHKNKRAKYTHKHKRTNIHAQTYTHKRTHINAHAQNTRTNIYIYTHKRTGTNIHAQTYTHKRTRTNIHARIYTHKHTRTNVYTNVHAQTYTRTNIHACLRVQVRADATAVANADDDSVMFNRLVIVSFRVANSPTVQANNFLHPPHFLFLLF